jgi:hypothetical protein
VAGHGLAGRFSQTSLLFVLSAAVGALDIPAVTTSMNPVLAAVLLASFGLGMALAFGLGGRETAGLVSGAYTTTAGARSRATTHARKN